MIRMHILCVSTTDGRIIVYLLNAQKFKSK